MTHRFRQISVTAVMTLGVIGSFAAPGLAGAKHHGPRFDVDDHPRCTIKGSAGDDHLRGTAASDVICARGGNDRIAGLDGDDMVYGGGGDDTVVGGRGADMIHVDGGTDLVYGGRHADRIHGGYGSDVLVGNGGDDTIKDTGGVDECYQDEQVGTPTDC